jgi:acetylglutamate kinase
VSASVDAKSLLAERARVLAEALPYLRAFRGAVVVVKYGGAAMTDGALADAWAGDVVLLEHVGLRPVVVHGGGPALTRTLARLGVETQFVDGHRVTTAESAEVAEMVLSGRLNKEVVARVNRAGGRAVGLSGTDAGMIRVRRRESEGVDLGFVGEVEELDPGLIHALLQHHYIPVLSSTAAGLDGRPYNINADLVAGALAGTLGAKKLVFLSDVAGILEKGERLPVLRAEHARRLLREGIASSGMRPKLEAGLSALGAGVPRVHFVDGRQPHALLLEIFTDDGAGSLLLPDDGEPGRGS